MPRDASGAYTLPTNDSSPAAPRNVIRSSDFNEITGDLATALTDSWSRSGDGAALADLDMDGHDFLNSPKIDGAAQKAQNLNDLADKASSRLNVKVPTYVATRTALKALDTTKDVSAILQESGREGVFTWTAGDFSALVAADTQSAVYVKADAIAATAGAWVRQRDNELTVNASWFGAVGDAGVSGTGGTDDAAAFQAANTLLKALGGGVIAFDKRHLIGTNLALDNGVSLRSPVGRADPGNPFGVTTDFFQLMQTVPAILLDPAVSIDSDSAGGISHVYIFRKGIKLDGTDLPSEFTGTAIIASAVDSFFAENSSVIGFQYAFVLTNSSRTKFDDVLIDCRHGVHLLGSGDVDRFDKVHCYGVTQEGATGHETFSLRDGYALFFGGTRVGGASVTNFFSYGFAVGNFVSTEGSLTLDGVWCDGPTDETTGVPLGTDNYGIILSDTAEIQISNAKICCQNKALVLGAGNAGTVLLSNFNLWQNNVTIEVTSGTLKAANGYIRTYFANGLLMNNATVSSAASFVNTVFADRRGSALDVNAGTGDIYLDQETVFYDGGLLDVQNEQRTTVAISAGVITIPNGKTKVRVTGTGAITNIAGLRDGVFYDLECVSAGVTIADGGNFRLAGAAAFSSSAGSTIAFLANRSTSKWVEKYRAI